jgi:hypothetical protein
MADATHASEVSSLLYDLAQLSAHLNAASDSINDVIKRFEATLQSLNLGLEVWVEGDDFDDPNDVINDMIASDSEVTKAHEAQETQLGFCRVGEQWQLCLRTAGYVIQQGRFGYEWRFRDASEAVPLRKASRAKRIEALPRFPALLRALKKAAETALKTIEEAKTFVEAC